MDQSRERFEAQLARTRCALQTAPPLLEPSYAVITALAAVRPGSPPPGTPDAWSALFELPFADRRAELRRRLGYVFWTRELADALAARLAARGCERRVEVAAGAGRLTLELMARGVEVVATDSYDQSADAVAARRAVLGQVPQGSVGRVDGINMPEWVERRDAVEALHALQPDVVLVAWPPLGSGMVAALLAERDAALRALLFIGEPDGCSEAPAHPSELPAVWRMERWEACERFLIGFTDHRLTPEDTPLCRSQIFFYRHEADPAYSPRAKVR